MLGTRIALLKDGRLEEVARADEFMGAKSQEARAFLATMREEPFGKPHAIQ